MRLFDIRCTKCKQVNEIFVRDGRKTGDAAECPSCGGSAIILPPLVNSDLEGFAKPIEMESCATIDDKEVTRFQKAGIEVHSDPRDPRYGIPIARNRSEKKKILKHTKFAELS